MAIRPDSAASAGATDPATTPHDGNEHADGAVALVARLDAAGSRSTAELLNALRQAFPDAPLAVRAAALKAIGRR
jgi:hypothetical protein